MEENIDKAEETRRLWDEYSSQRSTWARHAREDSEFRYGKQWTQSQIDKLEARGHSPIVVNRIHPAVETAKALITSKKPSFRVSPREDSDNKTAQAMNGLLEYVWQISDGDMQLRDAVDDFYVTGIGALHVYQDPVADMGKGEVKIKNVDPQNIYIDPKARDRFGDDASNIIVSREYTKAQAKKLAPYYQDLIDNAQGNNLSDAPETGRSGDDGAITYPEDVPDTISGDEDEDTIRGFERYEKVMVNRYRVFESFSNTEDLLDQKEFQEYVKMPAWIINGQVVVNEEKAKLLTQRLMTVYKRKMALYNKQLQKFQEFQGELEYTREVGMDRDPQGVGEDIPRRPEEPQIEQVTFGDLISKGAIKVVKVHIWRVKQSVVMGDTLLYERILPTKHYPIILFMNLHTRTPYPTSDVRMVKKLQQYINKTRSLIIAHATTSTNTKVLLPKGSVDKKEFEEKWAQPGVAIEVDMEAGAPTPVQPTPLPNELYKNEMDAKKDIDHQLGIFELMMGKSESAPPTYKATVSIDEFGQRKLRSKLAVIETGLKRLGEVCIPMMQQLYTTEKVARVIQPNHTTSEYMINKRMYDDKGDVIDIINNISVGKYDVIVVAGSTLPTNRYAQLELYMDAYKNGIIDRQEVLKKTEVFDMEGVLQRTDIIGKLKKQVQGMEEEMKKLKGDLQTREREVYHAKQQLAVEKFESKLDKTKNQADAAATVFEQRLGDAEKEASRDMQEIRREKTKTQGTS